MFIQTEITPNPSTLKFLPGRVVMNDGTAFYKSKSECINSPLAQRLFSIEGVVGVFFGSDFLTHIHIHSHRALVFCIVSHNVT